MYGLDLKSVMLKFKDRELVWGQPGDANCWHMLLPRVTLAHSIIHHVTFDTDHTGGNVQADIY